MTAHDCAWLCMTKHDWEWLSMTEHDWAWLRMTEHDWAWLSMTDNWQLTHSWPMHGSFMARESHNSGLNRQKDTRRNHKVTYWALCRSQKLTPAVMYKDWHNNTRQAGQSCQILDKGRCWIWNCTEADGSFRIQSYYRILHMYVYNSLHCMQ